MVTQTGVWETGKELYGGKYGFGFSKLLERII